MRTTTSSVLTQRCYIPTVATGADNLCIVYAMLNYSHSIVKSAHNANSCF